MRPGQYARRQAGPRSALKEQGLLGESLRGSRGVDFSAAVTAAGSAHDEPEHREEIAADLAAQGLAPCLVIVEAPPEE